MKDNKLRSNYRPRNKSEEPAAMEEPKPAENEKEEYAQENYEYFRRILDYDPDDDDEHDVNVEREEITEAIEDLMETIVQGADEIGQMIIDGIDDIISVM